LKTASVVGVGREKLGGGYITVLIKGDVAAVRAAVDAGKAKVEGLGRLIAAHVIPSPAKACCPVAEVGSWTPHERIEENDVRSKQSRRQFFGAAGVTAAMVSALADPPHAAAQSVGVKPADLPDLTIKEVKVYVADVSSFRRLNSARPGRSFRW